MTVQELEAWYEGRDLPDGPVWLNKATKINNVEKFVEGRFFAIRSNQEPRQQQSCIDKLIQLKEWLEENNSPPAHS